MIGTIGNKIWNYATDNKDKIIFNIDSTSFNDSIREKLENAGMNYYCVTNGKNARIAINTSDKDILKSIFDNDTYSSITFTKPQKDYTPDSNKIGNSKHIPEKCYYWMNKDMALSIADYLEKQGIPYSGILYTNNTKIKLSVSAENAPLMRRCIKNAKQQRIHFLNELYSVAEYNYFNRQVKLNSFDMPDVLLDCGLNARPMHYTNGLNETQLHRLPSLLENPVMVYRSLKQIDNIVVVTSDMDSHNNPIIVSISPDKNGDYKFERVNSTFATTSKGRNIFANHIAKEINSGNMLFTDKEKKQDLYNALNLQLSDISENINNDEISDNVPEQVEQTNVSENTEHSVISDFREKTEELFHDVNGYKPDDIELSVQNYILEKLEQNNINASLDNVILTGSRSRGLERSDSDIDVVAEISSPDLKEDALFNILNEEPMDIDGIKIDINPIRKEETGTLESYLPIAEKYLTEKRAAKEQVEEKENARTVDDIAIGDKYLLKDSFDEKEVTVTSMMGIYSNDVGITQHYNDNGMEYDMTSNIDKYKLHNNGVYLGNENDTPNVDVEKEPDINESQNTSPAPMKTTNELFSQNDITEKSPFIISPNVEAKLQTQQIENLSKENLENSNSEKQNQNDVNNTKTQEEDVPLFNDEAVFEEIEKAEKSKEDKEIQNTNTYGEQLSLFGNNEPLNTSTAATTRDKSKSEFSPGPIVDGVQVYEALAEEIDFGTGVEHGKIRIQNFYDEKQPSLNELANFMKKEYGIGGHSGNGNIFSVDHDSHGITFTFENGEKFRHSWYNVAVMTETRLSNDTYLSAEQKVERAEQLKKSVTDKIENNEVQNFTITDNTLGEGGAKTKFKNNIAAIEALKTLEKENRPANDEEKELLSKYVGWGGIAQAFDKDNKAWENEYSKLKSVLDDKEYKEARSSVLDSYFTAPAIIDGIYEALNEFGFKCGNVLEPSMGVGNFFGRMPTEMQKNSNLYGIEIDGISGRIAKKLYPNADISVMGFEENSFQNGCFDVAVGNVPFGELSFKDDKHHTTKLHDYFFAETLDKVKNGGIIAFITSSGTLDKRDESTRKALSEKADFIGAIRLPGGKNGAFKNNAGTEVTTDIIFLQKNDNKPVKAEKESWVSIGETADGLPVNNYFAENPDMVLGKIVEGNKLYGSGTMVIAEDNFDLNAELSQAVKKLSAKISDEKTKDVYAKSYDGITVKTPSELRNYSYFEQNNKIYFKINNLCKTVDDSDTQYDRFKSFIELRDTMREVLEAQELDKSDETIKSLQIKLNTIYDKFYKKYGLIHNQTNKKYFSEDISYNLVSGLEEKFEKNKLIEKSDIFTKRTIRPPRPIDHCETALEALTLSISEKAKVDFEYMNNLTGMTEDELKKGLVGEIYKVPHTKNTYQTASEYLSGDIRAKLKAAKEVAEYDSDFNVNVNALKNALPEPLKAGDIDVKIGATWIDPKYYEQFLYETLKTPKNNRNDVKHFRWQKTSLIEIEYSEHTSNWRINNKSSDNSVISTQQYGSKRMNAYEIMEHLLNLKEPKVYKTIMVPDGMGDVKEKRVVDVDATRVVQQKADRIKKEFKKWIFKDPERRKNIVNRYNELFNSIRPREYDGSNLSFPMMNTDIKLHDHQKNAIAHAMFGGNTLFAHAVGAGKTFEMIATAMESKRLGLCTKSLFAVPNHLTEQIGNDFRKLYPSANILVATKKDFQKENRQQLFAKIATGNFDAVIIGHSQLGMIPISKERQENLINSQIDDIVKGIAELRASDGSKFQVKQMERTKKSLEKNLDNLKKRHDDTITFEQLGVDKLFVDEAHEFKNLFTPTKLNNIAGISTSASQKALDLFMKCRYLDEKTGGKGVVFATGTPLSNSITELHTMMRYLEYDFLKDHGLSNFDNWVTVFGEQKTDWELAPAGNKFKERTRIANYTGLPELMSMFKQVADVRTADTLDLDVPNCEYKVVNVEATPFQKILVQELSDRADEINNGNVDPSIDNMLKITSDGRKLGLDPRLIDPSFEDNPNTKLNQCVENVARIYEETAEDKLTQIIFCDLGVPHKSSAAKNEKDNDTRSTSERESLEEECDFCVYDDIKKKLMAKGISENEIAYIHDAKTEKQKSELFDKVRSGEVRVLLGSTAKMGTGTNVQKKLIAVHDLDIPWRPADLEQRAGRIIRQGNENKNVSIYRYVTKGTFDAYSYQTLENKQKFISQIMTSKTPARRCQDVDQQAFTYSEIKALCTGDDRIKEKLILDNDVKELQVLASEYQNTVYEMQDKVNAFPDKEKRFTTALDKLRTDREYLRTLPIDGETKLPVFKITIGNTEYTDRKEAPKALEKAALDIKQLDTPVEVGSFQGLPLSITINSHAMGDGLSATIKGEYPHSTTLIDSFSHNLRRLEGCLYNIDSKIDDVKTDLAKLRLDYKEAQKIVSEPFEQAQELAQKESRLKELTEILNRQVMELKKSPDKRVKTCYFQQAQLRKERRANRTTHSFSIDKLEMRAKDIDKMYINQNQKNRNMEQNHTNDRSQ